MVVVARLVKMWHRLSPVTDSRRDPLDDLIKIQIFWMDVTGGEAADNPVP